MQHLPSGSHTSDKVYLLQTSLAQSDSPSSVAGNFRQRQTDVFACLAGLEAAHKEVTKATKDERKAIQRATWRRPSTAPEDLATEKERRDSGQRAAPVTPVVTQPAGEFRRPVSCPRPRVHPRPPRTARDPSKWTHYSLADVDEDGIGPRSLADTEQTNRGDPNFAIAASFLSELRKRREVQSNECSADDEPMGPGDQRRILFRPSRGTKRMRSHETSANPTPSASITASDDLSPGESEDQLGREAGDPPANVFSTFIARRQRGGRFRGRQTSSADAESHETEEGESADTNELTAPNESGAELPEDLYEGDAQAKSDEEEDDENFMGEDFLA